MIEYIKGDKLIEVVGILIKAKQDSTYAANIACHNCGCCENVLIPKRTTIQQYKMNRVCPDCGCKIGDK